MVKLELFKLKRFDNIVTKRIKTSIAAFKEEGTFFSFLRSSLTLFTESFTFVDLIFTIFLNKI